MTSIGGYAFYDCSGLTSVTIGNNVTSIGSYAFARCNNLATVTLGNGIRNIYSYAFANCGQLTDVYCFAENIPSTYFYAFNNSYIDYVTLHVSAGSVDAYNAKYPWNGFKEIVAIETVKVKLNKTNVTLEKGKTVTLKATVSPSTFPDKSVTWKSSDTKIATVTSKGKVKGVKYGTATITCTSKATGVSATCQVTVGKVVISMSEFSLKKSRTTVLTAIVYPTTLTDKSVTWKSSDTKVATVTSSGKVKGIAAGTATITCTSVATGLKGTCTMTVLSTSESRSLDGDDDETTGIEENVVAVEPFDVYDLSGHKVLNQVTSLDGLPKGIYIVNGRKVLKKE